MMVLTAKIKNRIIMFKKVTYYSMYFYYDTNDLKILKDFMKNFDCLCEEEAIQFCHYIKNVNCIKNI